MAFYLQLHRVRKALTDAQIKALPTTPIALVSAPGAGYRIKGLGYTLRLNSSAGVYTNIDTTYATLQVQTTAGNWVSGFVGNDDTTTPALAALTNLLNTAHHAVVDLPPTGGAVRVQASGDAAVMPFAAAFINTAANGDGLGLEIAADNNGSGNFTGGNAANSMVVIVTYLVEPI